MMNFSPGQQLSLSRASFEDVDEMVEWSRQVGWDNVGTQLTPGSNEIAFDSFALPGLIVGHYRVGQSIHNLFALPEGMVLFLICRAKLPLVWCGRHLPPSLLGIARCGREHEVVLNAGWDSYEFMISEDLIRHTEVFPEDFFERTRQLENALLPLMEPVTGIFLKQMDKLFERSRGACGGPDSALTEPRVLDFVVRGLLEVIDTGLQASGAPGLRPARRPDLVSRARDYIAAHPTLDLSTEALAATLGVSYRVLHYAFQDTLGISPYRYVLTQRLHGVRRLLKSGEASVGDACARHGFDSPSRFAQQYTRHFNELPSATRSRSIALAVRRP
jgi:AraC-like DNA-binding protein